MKKMNDSIVEPKAIKGFRRKRTVYIPVDSPSQIIKKTLKRKALKEKNLGFSSLYLLKDKVVLYQSIGAPATAAVILAAPILAALGAFAALVTECTIEVEKIDES